MKCAVFSVQRSAFSVQCSAFSVQRSVFSVQFQGLVVQCLVISLNCTNLNTRNACNRKKTPSPCYTSSGSSVACLLYETKIQLDNIFISKPNFSFK